MRPEETLTAREMECVKLLVRGGTSESTALLLGCARGTVRRHLSNAYRKIGIANHTEVIAWWNSRFGLEADVRYVEAKLADAERTIELFGVDFKQSVEAEAGRLMRRFIEKQSGA